MRDIVVGIDASTTAVKAAAFLRDGTQIFLAREACQLTNPLPGHFEQNPEDWRTALVRVLKQLTGEVASSRIAALSIAHQRETFTLIDHQGRALTPAILWLDERARPQVARLARELGRETIREWSGKPPDPTPALYAVAWLSEHRPAVLRQATAIVDVGGFLMRWLTGRLVTSTASADPLGMLAVASGTWHPALVAAAGLRPEQLPELAPPGTVCGGLTPEVAVLTGLPAGAPIVAGAGDGQATGLGMGICEPDSAYLSLGSGVVSGMFTPTLRTSDAFRTMIAPTASGYMLETVLRSGMQLVDWIVRTTGASPVAALEAKAAGVAPGSDGLLVLPYWAGVMNPYWDEAARGAIVGLSLDHRPAHLLRAVFEGIAFEQGIATKAMEDSVGTPAARMTAAGGGANSRLLMQILASVLERPISVSPVNEAAALGAAMLAAAAIGWYASIEAASRQMTAAAAAGVEPDASLVASYRPRKDIYRDLYHATKDVHARLRELDPPAVSR